MNASRLKKRFDFSEQLVGKMISNIYKELTNIVDQQILTLPIQRDYDGNPTECLAWIKKYHHYARHCSRQGIMRLVSTIRNNWVHFKRTSKEEVDMGGRAPKESSFEERLKKVTSYSTYDHQDVYMPLVYDLLEMQLSEYIEFSEIQGGFQNYPEKAEDPIGNDNVYTLKQLQLQIF